jgi:hypothetical protein
MSFTFFAADPLTYRRTLFRRKRSLETPASGASCMKLACMPAPIDTAGSGGSCARAGAARSTAEITHETTIPPRLRV